MYIHIDRFQESSLLSGFLFGGVGGPWHFFIEDLSDSACKDNQRRSRLGWWKIGKSLVDKIRSLQGNLTDMFAKTWLFQALGTVPLFLGQRALILHVTVT
jgi:hypothetical protein